MKYHDILEELVTKGGWEVSFFMSSDGKHCADADSDDRDWHGEGESFIEALEMLKNEIQRL